MQIPQYNERLTVRPIKAEDQEAARRLATRAFGGNCLGWYDLATSIVGEDEEGAIVCALEYRVESLWWGTAQVPGVAVGNVATDPASWGKGHAGALMVGAVHHFRERGWRVCPIWPSSFAYYGKFGWACPGPSLHISVWPDLARKLDAPCLPLRTPRIEDMETVVRLHNCGAQQTNCQSVRGEEWWTRKGLFNGLRVLENETGQVEAYALCEPKPLNRTQGLTLGVRESHASSFPWHIALIRSLAEWPEATAIDLSLPADSLLMHAFAERHDMTMHRHLDLRILDVAEALACLRPPEALRVQLSFEVMDWIVNAERPIAVTAEIEGGQVQVKPGSTPDAFRCDVNTFAQLFSGGLSVAQARAMGGLSGGNGEVDKACDALFYGRMPYRSKIEMG